MTFSLDTRSHSEVGLVRKNNQDSGYVSPTMLVVADGMGGAAAGDLASTVAVHHVARADAHREGEDMLETLAGAVSSANDELADLVAWDHSLDGMGTTFCGAMFSGTQLGVVHIGDSRAYLLRADKLTRLTHDHSWVQSLIDEGRITPEQAAVHPHRSLLLKVLNGQTQHSPDTSIVDVEVGDRILFCSDGLCGLVDDLTIARSMNLPDLDEVMSTLVARAHAAGGTDNITVVLAQVVPQSPALDAAAGTIIGAAATTRIPEHEVTAQIPLPEEDWRPEEEPRQVLFDSEAEESMRYAPIDSRSRRRVRPWLLGLTGLIILAVAGILGGRAYLATQYYVGANGPTVAIFQGVSDDLPGIDLHHVVQTSDVRVADLPTYYRSRVTSTITVSSVQSGQATIDELRKGADRCRAVRAARASTSASPTPSAPVSPTAGPTTPSPSSTPTVSRSGTARASGTPSPSASTTPSHVTPTATASPEVRLPSVEAADCS
ncbi:protein phosphatase 2C domain-containing protein [Acidipropionibacterium timonense]|uniref:protein phosphatase 2C domain-containing protein n=1 Tax=Acidipropionibacterium timonense TaxID=2161818 RepID=UPI00103069CF|nr:protein phosphatase 2C domain-containing protein [Acidipropionibacterium timonense]